MVWLKNISTTTVTCIPDQNKSVAEQFDETNRCSELDMLGNRCQQSGFEAALILQVNLNQPKPQVVLENKLKEDLHL